MLLLRTIYVCVSVCMCYQSDSKAVELKKKANQSAKRHLCNRCNDMRLTQRKPLTALKA